MVHIAIHHRDYSHLARRGTMYPVTAALLCLGFGQTSGFVLRSGSQLVFNKGWKASKTASCRTAEETVPSMKLTEVPFRKYQGLGNDFILVDNRLADEPVLTPEESAHLCDRRLGVGGDGVIFALPGKEGLDFSMRIINSDGSEPEMCGNGIRCMARFLADLEGRKAAEYKIHTLAGTIIPVARDDGLVTVDMGPPELDGPKVPTTLPTNADGVVLEEPIKAAGSDWEVTCVSMGNPHAVVFVDDVDAVDLATVGPYFENHPSFPARINTEFVQVLSREHLKMVVWERGCGITQACGTGACALVVAAVLTGRADRNCRVTLPGGDLLIEWREEDGKIYMTGPAQLAFQGNAVVS